MKGSNFIKIFGMARRSTPLLLTGMVLSGCAASRLMMRYSDLQTQTELSESIFLELRSNLPRTVFISEGSAVDRELTIRPSLEQQLTALGYTVVDTPVAATYIMQVNHHSLLEFELGEDQTITDAINSAMAAGVGAGLAADILGASDGAVGAVGLATGLVGFIADANTKHMAHTLTTDVRISETAPDAVGETVERYHETRIVSGASKVNLDWEESLPAIVQNLNKALASLMSPPNA